MSYDLMVFDPSRVPSEEGSFRDWYDYQTQWTEDRDYNDPSDSSPALRAWYLDMLRYFPAMNGPYAVDDSKADDPRVTDYCVGEDLVYMAFAWSQAEEAYATARRLAEAHKLGFFNVSSEDGDVWLPDAAGRLQEVFRVGG